MGETTGISWTEVTWNPWMGCTRVSKGCDGCYMFREQRQYGNDPELVRRSKTKFDLPLKIEKPSLVFTCSWSDWFHEAADAWRDEAWDIVRRSPQHTFQILTKRPGRIPRCLPDDWGDGYPNVWLGTSIESAQFNYRADHLRRVPAALRFLSCEPLLGSLFPKTTDGSDRLADATATGDSNPVQRGDGARRQPSPLDLSGIGWVIIGGESGPRQQRGDIPPARPMHPDWAREIVNAVLYGTPHRPSFRHAIDLYGDPDAFERNDPKRPRLHMKQWGSWAPNPDGPDGWWVLPNGDRMTHMYADAHGIDLNGAIRMRYAGPKPTSGGKLLDGVDWCEIPDRLTLA